MPLKMEKIRRLKSVIPGRVLVEAVSYRIPLPVTEITEYWSGDRYPLCPRCGRSLEREYMGFCDRCGQRLGWSMLQFAKVHSSERFDV